ncbi:MAG: GNAT family N-acetyltransferase [Sulfitobacter sp.]
MALLEQSHALLAELFPSEENHNLSVDELCAKNVRFYTATSEHGSVGCAALALHSDYVELKSMYVTPSARGQSVAKHLLENIVAEAKRENVAKIVLETGIGLDAAYNLYKMFGFRDRNAFGSYKPDALYSRYMELTL